MVAGLAVFGEESRRCIGCLRTVDGVSAAMSRMSLPKCLGPESVLEPADEAQAVGVDLAAVVLKVTAGPVGADAVAAIEEVVRAGAVV